MMYSKCASGVRNVFLEWCLRSTVGDTSFHVVYYFWSDDNCEETSPVNQAPYLTLKRCYWVSLSTLETFLLCGSSKRWWYYAITSYRTNFPRNRFLCHAHLALAFYSRFCRRVTKQRLLVTIFLIVSVQVVFVKLVRLAPQPAGYTNHAYREQKSHPIYL